MPIIPVVPSSSFTPGDGASFGPCQAWEPIWCDLLPAGSEAVSGYALDMATEILWAKSGRQFGFCQMKIRPCRQNCFGNDWPFNNWFDISGGIWPRPLLFDGNWYNIACGSCAGDCSCAMLDEISLPGPIVSVDEVRVDGLILTPDIDYRLDDWRKIVRLGDQWPACNNLNLADTQVGTWSVTATWGKPVPQAGRFAVGELALQIIRACVGDGNCTLPQSVQRLARQGVTLEFADPQLIFDSNRIGLTLCDMFISSYNPDNLRSPSKVYNLDQPGYRIAGV